MVFRLGFIVNPIAGMGGRVGLKGTDNVLKEAIARGAQPVAPKRAIEFLSKLKQNDTETHIEVLTCPDSMGKNEADKASLPVKILPMKIGRETSAEDTKSAVDLSIAARVDLIVFVGGDGTAKNILDALRDSDSVPVLGVPSGVKMYSGVFAVNPADAVDVVLAFTRKQAETIELEVMDTDENDIRQDAFNMKLYGYLKTPVLPAHVQGSKQASPDTVDELDNQTAIARFIVEQVPADAIWILGPGTTVKRLAELLGVEKTLLGVDIYTEDGALLDVNEKQILENVKDWQNTWIVLSPIGHQGILLGRGNQQISPQILKKVGKEHVVVAATKNKLQTIDGNLLRVDTGDPETDSMLRGYIKVVTDYREWRLVKVQ
jgi:predicted polyphosphate/ATP-dependent NAD kinase